MGKYTQATALFVERPERDNTFWTDIVHAYSRDSGSLPCDGASNISLRNILKTGPEEAQYFHVRPPIGFI